MGVGALGGSTSDSKWRSKQYLAGYENTLYDHNYESFITTIIHY